MADAVRRLIAITVDSDADAATTADAAARIDALAGELEAMVKDPAPSKHGVLDTGEGSHPHDHFQFDVMLGLYNPLALPIEMSWEPPHAVGNACFTSPYEGPPGCVHGAIIAGAFDQVFNVANVTHGIPGPTAYLHIDYRRPTLLRQPLRFVGWVDAVEGRKITCRGRLEQGGEVTCEAEGLFINVSRAHIEQMGAPVD